jgi:preprotein translocase subunit SecA
MAGRGVDIILGGKKPNNGDAAEWRKNHDKVVTLSGLHIIGTERHEARRIDNQLRGRAGRQGDPGSSRFYVSLEDDIMQRFGGDRIKGFMQWVGLDEDTPIENALLTKAITDVQKRVEGYHFDIRKHLVEYDDVVNKHREVIYSERRKILSGANLKANILSMVAKEIQSMAAVRIGDGYDWEPEGLLADVATVFPLPLALNASTISSMRPKQIEDRLIKEAETLYEAKEQEIGPDDMRVLERLVMLRTIDNLWVEHLTMMEHMRMEAGWQTLRQVRAVDAYKNEGFKQFQVLLSTIQHDVAHTIYHVNLTRKETPKEAPSPMTQMASGAGDTAKAPQTAASKKTGRNDPCPCGSGKKYKKCCGK